MRAIIAGSPIVSAARLHGSALVGSREVLEPQILPAEALLRTALILSAVTVTTWLQIPGHACAGAITVPDDVPTVQVAIDLGTDTVFIRTGEYAEIPLVPRGVVIIGLGSQPPRLAGLDIANPNSQLSRVWLVEGVEFAGPVRISTPNYENRLLDISFVRCRLFGGVQHDQSTSSDPYDIMDFRLLGCQLGKSSLGRSARVVMHADTVDAGISWGVVEHASVDSCWFRGGSREALQLWGDVGVGQIESNVFEDAARGVSISNCERVDIRSNVIRRMSEVGMEVRGKFGVLEGNSIEDCGTGLWSSCDGVRLERNSCVRIRNMAAYFLVPESIVAERNVFGDCGGDAIFIQSPFMADITFRQNTLYLAGGSGLVVADGGDNTLFMEGNIVFGSGGFGLYMASTLLSDTLRCNDWFGNGRGAVYGMGESALDFTADPSFCNVAEDDVSLSSDSPLVVGSGCVQIGALGAGCSPPKLDTLVVTSRRAGLGLEWGFVATSAVECWVERADQASGPWDSLGTGTRTVSNSFALLDAAVAPDRRYQYRVSWKDRGNIVRGAAVTGTWTDAGALSGVSPNPSRGEVQINWILAKPGAADIRIFDVAGREVAQVVKGPYGVGRQKVQWDGRLGSGGPAPAGLYLVRISAGDVTLSQRVLLVR